MMVSDSDVEDDSHGASASEDQACFPILYPHNNFSFFCNFINTLFSAYILHDIFYYLSVHFKAFQSRQQHNISHSLPYTAPLTFSSPHFSSSTCNLQGTEPDRDSDTEDDSHNTSSPPSPRASATKRKPTPNLKRERYEQEVGFCYTFKMLFRYQCVPHNSHSSSILFLACRRIVHNCSPRKQGPQSLKRTEGANHVTSTKVARYVSHVLLRASPTPFSNLLPASVFTPVSPPGSVRYVLAVLCNISVIATLNPDAGKRSC